MIAYVSWHWLATAVLLTVGVWTLAAVLAAWCHHRVKRGTWRPVDPYTRRPPC